MAVTLGNRPLDIGYFPSQAEFFLSDMPGVQFRCAPKGRRAGFTQGAANFVTELLMEEKKILWGDTINSNLQRYYDRYINPLLKNINPRYWSYSPKLHQLTFKDGYIDFRSAERPENWEGFGYEYIILNEAGLILKGMKGRRLWSESLLPMILDFSAKVYLVGTPKGKEPKKDEKAFGYTTSLYYELCQKGEDPNNEKWWTNTYSSYTNPIIKDEDIEELKKEVPPETRDQEIYGKFISVSGRGPFERKWFHIVDTLPPLKEWRNLIISCDTAFKESEDADATAAIIGLNARNGYYILGMYNKRVDFVNLATDINELYERHNYRWGKGIQYVLIEDKASGISLAQTFKKKTKMPVKEIKVKDNKYERAVATTPIFETGNVMLYKGGWNEEFIQQFLDFTILLDTPDDIVDATSQFINFFEGKYTNRTKFSEMM